MNEGASGGRSIIFASNVSSEPYAVIKKLEDGYNRISVDRDRDEIVISQDLMRPCYSSNQAAKIETRIEIVSIAEVYSSGGVLRIKPKRTWKSILSLSGPKLSLIVAAENCGGGVFSPNITDDFNLFFETVPLAEKLSKAINQLVSGTNEV